MEIFALVACFHFSAQPSWNTCQTMGRHYTFSTAEQCQTQLNRHPTGSDDAGAGGVRTIEFKCMKQSVASWQPAKPKSVWGD
jgi:hypothetical protein